MSSLATHLLGVVAFDYHQEEILSLIHYLNLHPAPSGHSLPVLPCSCDLLNRLSFHINLWIFKAVIIGDLSLKFHDAYPR